MRKTLWSMLSLFLILSLILSACGAPIAPTASDQAAAPSGPVTDLPRSETLYTAGFQWNTPNTFNPLNADPTWPGMARFQQIYESLFVFNLLTGDIDPQLASSYEFVDDLTMAIELFPGTTWSDGETLDTEDVVFTYGLARDHEGLPYGTVFQYIDDITATDDRNLLVTINAEAPNVGFVKNFLATIRIIPEHIWAERAALPDPINQFVDMDPVGSGPYKVHSTSTERVALERLDDYWGGDVHGLPAPKYLVHPIFASNDDGNLALSRNEIDISQQFVPQIWQMWENGGNVGTWYDEEPFYIPGGIPMMHINISVPGLDNPLVRRALAHSINYPLIAETAMSRYSIPVESSLLVPGGGEEPYIDRAQLEALGWEYNPAETARILEEEAGATKGSDGIYVLPDGTRLGPYTVSCPFGWTDWMTALEIVAQSATEAGIEVVTEFPDRPVHVAGIRSGDFQLSMESIAASTAATPWQRYRDLLDDRGVPERGGTAFWNFARFASPDGVHELLDRAAATTDEEEKAEIFSELDQVYMENIPAIGLMYRPLEFYEFNTTYWSGFPTAENPTSGPLHRDDGIRIFAVLEPTGQ